MSYIDNTRRSSNHAYEITVCITKEECKLLLPFFREAHKKVKQKYNKYQDIHEGGEATERQENMLLKYTEELEHLESILLDINNLVK